MSYKDAKEAFVSHLEGSTIADVLCVLLLAVIWTTINRNTRLALAAWNSPFLSLVVDVFLLVLPLLLVITVLADLATYTLPCSVLLLLISFLVIKNASKFDSQRNSFYSDNNLHFITTFKGLNVLLTCMAILAVDFPLFPRRFAKTESTGVSLMDAGVGAFIISSAITSRHSRGLTHSSNNSSNHSSASERQTWTAMLARAIVHLTGNRGVVLLLGVGRLVAVKMLNYQEHVSEYGVHWNFFVTLFCVWTAADYLHNVCVLSRRMTVILSVCVLLLYQSLLSDWHFADYLFSTKRDDFVSANKEGIFSLLGYIPLFLISEELSHALFFADRAQSHADESMPPSSPSLLLRLVQDKIVCRLSLVTWVLWGISLYFSRQDTSRRLCNAPYVSLSLSFVLFVLLWLRIWELIRQPQKKEEDEKPEAEKETERGGTLCMDSIDLLSKHSLAVFLFANVMTGAVNASLETIHCSTPTALGVLSAYSVTVALCGWMVEWWVQRRRNKVDP